MRAYKIFEAIDRFAPFSVHASYDNPGFLIGDPDAEITAAVVALDITPEVVQEAVRLGAEMIVAHHPVLFKPVRRLLVPDPAYLCARNGLCAVCAHTNLDVARGGVNDVFAQRLGITDTEILYDSEKLPLGRVGQLAMPQTLQDFAAFVKRTLSANTVRFCDAGKSVRRIAVIGGACDESDLEIAVNMGVDTLVTGDSKYHYFLHAKQIGLNLIDAGHFATENPIVDVLRDYLTAQCAEVTFITSAHRDVVESV